MTKLLRALLLLGAPITLQAQSPQPHLFTKKDAWWSAAFLAGTVALSVADVDIARVWNDSTHRSLSRDNLARNFAKIQEGTLTVGNLALWGVARLTHARGMADVTFHAAESVVAGSIV